MEEEEVEEESKRRKRRKGGREEVRDGRKGWTEGRGEGSVGGGGSDGRPG